MPGLVNRKLPPIPTPIRLPHGWGEIRVLGPVDHRLGYESRPGTWPWIMVPLRKTRKLVLRLDCRLPVTIQNLDSHGRFMWTGSPYFSARIDGEHLSITGLYPSSYIPVDLYQPDSKLRLFVSVKPPMTLPIIAHYVEHGPLLRTRTTPEGLRRRIDVANSILQPQANVRLVLKKDNVLSYERIGKRLGLKVDFDKDKWTDPNSEWSLITKHKLDVPVRKGFEYPPLNLFLMRGFREPDKQGRDSLARTSRDGCCLLGDNEATEAGEVLAHEAVHHLLFLNYWPDGEHHNKLGLEYLMYEKGGRGTRLTRDEIEGVNPTGRFRLESLEDFGVS